MLVKLAAGLTGTRNGRRWPAIGETIELPKGEALALVNARLAEPAESIEEHAVLSTPVETRPKKATPKKRAAKSK